jgi:hypothetical protein
MNEMQFDGNVSQKYMQAIQCLSDFREADFSNEETFDSFMQILSANADYFASQTHTDTENYFSQFTHDGTKSMVYYSLANSVIMYWNLGESYAIKNNIREESVYNEILAFFQLLTCSNEQIQQYDLSKNFDKIAGGKNKPRKTSSNNLEENINVLLNEVKNLKNIIMDQSKMIDQVKNENKEIKNELLKMSQKIETRSAFSFTQPMPTIPVLNTTTNTNSTSSNNKSNTTQTNSLFSSKVVANITTPSTKRPLANQNNNSNKVSRPTPNAYSNRNKSHPQSKIASFNSFNPNETSVIQIDGNGNEGFKTVNNKRNKKNNNSSSNNKINNNNNYNNNNNNNNNNKRKPFRQDYSKIIGRGVSSELSAKPKQFYIYLGKLDLSATVDTVKSFLENQFKAVKFNENETREVKISNLKELNEHFDDRTFKSFSFSVSVLDKEIVKMKDLFPLYSIVNQHRLSHAEWTAITQKFKNNRHNFATTSNQV